MAKKVSGFVKLQIPAGKANPAPPVGTALGPQGINIMAFCKEFNARTQGQDTILPVEITIFADKSFTFILKTPPAASCVKKESGDRKGIGSAEPQQGRARSPRRRSGRSPRSRCPTSTPTRSSPQWRWSPARRARWVWRSWTDEDARQEVPAPRRRTATLDTAYQARQALEIVKNVGVRQVRRDGRGRRPPRRRSASRRSGRARHRRAARGNR